MKKRGKILLIEDNKMWYQRLIKLYINNGFFVVHVYTEEEALKRIAKENFHVVSVDLQLNLDTLSEENFEGWRILTAAKGIFADVVVISGFPGLDEENIKKALSRKYGAIFFMKKSEFDKNTLINYIIEVVDKHNFRFINDHRE